MTKLGDADEIVQMGGQPSAGVRPAQDDQSQRDERARRDLIGRLAVGLACLASTAAGLVIGIGWRSPALGVLVAVSVPFTVVAFLTRHRALRLAEIHLGAVSGRFDELAAGLANLQPSGLALADGSVVLLPVSAATVDPRVHIGSPEIPRSATQKSGSLRDALITSSPGLGLAAAATYSYWENATALDDNLLQALEALSGQQVNGLADFLSLRDVKSYQLDSVKLRGHIGEQDAYDTLREAGLDVQWPKGGATEYGPTNNPGWDLTVEGTPVNVKVVEDATEAAQAHFADYPDIPMIVNADAANIPVDAIHFDGTWPSPEELAGEHVTIVMDAVDLGGIEADQEAAESVDDPMNADSVADAIPTLTFLLAAVRSAVQEGRLLSRGDTDVGRALQHVAVDTALKGGGASAGFWAGAQLGALIDAATGGATMGLGALIGGILGLMGGAKLGGSAASHIKTAPLRRARDLVRIEVGRLESAVQRASEKAQEQLQMAIDAQRALLTEAAGQARLAYLSLLAELSATMGRAATLAPDESAGLLARSLAEIDRRIDVLAAGVQGESLLVRLWANPAVKRSRGNREAWLRAAESARDRIAQDGVSPFFDHLMATHSGELGARRFLQGYSEQRLRCAAIAKQGDDMLSAAILAARSDAVAALRVVESEARAEASREVQEAADRVKAANTALVMEAKAAGLL